MGDSSRRPRRQALERWPVLRHLRGKRPDSPISRGRLCRKGSATLQLTTGPAREHSVPYRKPYGADWEGLDLDIALGPYACTPTHR